MQRQVLLHTPGLIAYRDAWRWQQETAAAVREGAPEALAVLQHPPVYTLGRRGTVDNILLDPEALALRGADVVYTDRGGDVTYHGPGQLVAYPILNLHDRNLGAADYVRRLEDVMILTAARFGIAAHRVPGRPGIWANLAQAGPLTPLARGLGSGASPAPSSTHAFAPQPPDAGLLSARGEEMATARGGASPAKLGAVGVRVQQGITTHGLALNVDPDLSYFDAIVPCGLRGITVTSMTRLLNHPLDITAVQNALLDAFALVFDATLLHTTPIARQSAPARAEAISVPPPASNPFVPSPSKANLPIRPTKTSPMQPPPLRQRGGGRGEGLHPTPSTTPRKGLASPLKAGFVGAQPMRGGPGGCPPKFPIPSGVGAEQRDSDAQQRGRHPESLVLLTKAGSTRRPATEPVDVC